MSLTSTRRRAGVKGPMPSALSGPIRGLEQRSRAPSCATRRRPEHRQLSETGCREESARPLGSVAQRGTPGRGIRTLRRSPGPIRRPRPQPPTGLSEHTHIGIGSLSPDQRTLRVTVCAGPRRSQHELAVLRMRLGCTTAKAALTRSIIPSQSGFPLVGVTGFEPATSSSRTMRATKLRHTPIGPNSRQGRKAV